MRILRRQAAKACLFLMVIGCFLGLTPAAKAAAGNNALKMYEVAGAGGLAGATYREDTIILFNPTQAAITCTTCAIQTHSGTSTTAAWTVYKLPTLNIPAGGYYMISASSPSLSADGPLPPIPYDYELQTIEDGGVTKIATTQNILSSTVGEVALTSTTTALSVSGTQCGAGTQLLDLVGYGSDISTNSATSATPASCYAGTGEAYYDGSSALGRQLGITRKNKCIDTFNNANDWVNTSLTYFNSSSAPTVCPTGNQLSAVVAANPTSLGDLETIVFTAAVTPATLPAGGAITAVVNFNSIYYQGATVPMYDDGTHGDKVAGDGTYTVSTTIPAGTPAGFTYPTNVTVTDAAGNAYASSTRISILNGDVSLTTPTSTMTIKSGGVATFPITVTGTHGYGGIVLISCTGQPNANNLGVPVSTGCLPNPPEVTLAADGTLTFPLAIAAGTTFSAGNGTSSWMLAILALLSVGMLTGGIWRRKHLSLMAVLLLVSWMTLGASGCGTNGGLANTNAAPGTYIFTVTATDSNTSAVTASLPLTVIVQ